MTTAEGTASISSAEVSRNAKGEFSYKVKLYKEKDDETDAELADRTDVIVDRFDAKYPAKAKGDSVD